MRTTSIKRKRREGGSSIVEVALLAPWIFFLFVGVFDLGFYMYAASCTQNAARIAALQTASNPGLSSSQLQTMACNAAMLEMIRVPNTHTIASCGGTPLTVTQQTLTNASTPACADCAVDTTGISSLVTVTYQSGLYVPIPGLLEKQLNLTRTSETRMVIP
jgi:Flp pilus assembly protein TadG